MPSAAIAAVPGAESAAPDLLPAGIAALTGGPRSAPSAAVVDGPSTALERVLETLHRRTGHDPTPRTLRASVVEDVPS